MGEIVNLRRARKDRKREDADRKAEANRLAFGRSKAEKTSTALETSLAERRLSGHRLGSGTPADE